MIFSTRPIRDPAPNLYFCGTLIEEVYSHKHLGVALSNNSSWRKHIDNIVASSDKRMFILKKLSRKVPRKTLIILYRSILEYGGAVRRTSRNN
jgi:hypothetical protein